MLLRIVVNLLSKLQILLEIVLSFPFVGSLFDSYLSIMASCVRFYSGGFAAHGVDKCLRPKENLILYQYEGCPFCRKVREHITILALDVEIFPCPRTTLSEYGVANNISRNRNEAKRLSGECMFPLLVDNNINPPIVMLQSDHIINYLWTTYGAQATIPLTTYLLSKMSIFYFIPSLFRPLPHMGICRIPSRVAPPQALVLWSYEANPFARMVRELLDSLELHYIIRNVPMLSNHNKDEYKRRYGHLMSRVNATLGLIEVPLLHDPNTNTTLTHHSAILHYLHSTYALEGVKSNVDYRWASYSTKGATKRHGKME